MSCSTKLAVNLSQQPIQHKHWCRNCGRRFFPATNLSYFAGLIFRRRKLVNEMLKVFRVDFSLAKLQMIVVHLRKKQLCY